jgi:ubiquinone/menaquinone biosynthesis C-methylase UbiE
MSWFGACIYDSFMSVAERACLAAWRTKLLADLEGTVVEIGAGTGANLPYYPSLERLLLSEPDRHMRRKLERRVARDGGRSVELIDAPANRLPLDDEAVDAVVSTLVLCTVDDPRAVLAEVHRVLRPGGRLVVLEHVASDDVGRFRWQERIEPLWKRLAGNCHLTRRTAASIERSGFIIDELEHESMRKAFPFVRPTIRGNALKA